MTRQLEDCRALVETMGWDLIETYVDNDISATSGKVRPAYGQMLSAVESGLVDVIVAWAPDRIYRRLADLEDLIRIIDKQNVAIRTVKAGEFDLSTGMGRMIARILGSVAQGEGDIKSERWRRSYRQRREAGQIPGQGPRLFGYLKTGEIVPEEAEIIRGLVDSVIAGTAVNALAADLNAQGVLTTLGNRWSRTSLRQMLGNGRLAGWSLIDGEPVAPGQWEPILSSETFEQVRAALTARMGQERRPRVSLLSGLVVCAYCEQPLVSGRREKRGRETEGRRVYRCRKEPGDRGCGGVSCYADLAEEIVEAYAKQRLSDPAVRERMAEISGAAGEHTAEILALEDRVRDLEHQLDQPGIPVSTILRAIDRAKTRVEELRRLVALTPPASLPMGKGEWPDDLARRARLIRLVVERVTIRRSETRGRAFDATRFDITPR